MLPSPPQLTVLCRSLYQLQVALEAGCDEVLVELQDMRQIREAVATAGGASTQVYAPEPVAGMLDLAIGVHVD